MWLLIFLLSLVILLLVILGLITYARWNFGSLEKQGITVVEPSHFLLGGAMLAYEKNGGLLDIENMKKYGPVFGLYEGREPQIFICDAELIRLITTRDADHFDAKRALDFGEEVFNEMLDFQPYEKWRTMRGMFSPVVNSIVRLKNSNPAMRETIKNYIDDIKKQIEKNGGKLEKYGLNEGIYGMVTDLIARSQYSINIGKSDGSNRFADNVRTIMSSPASESPWIASYAYAFPFIKKILPNTLIHPEPVKEFVDIVNELMDIRRKQYEASGNGPPPTHSRDILDYIIEWFDDLKTNEEYKKSNVTEATIYLLGILMFIGGQDQISLIVGALMNFISKNPKIEKRVQEEVDKVWKQTNGIFDHESLGEMTYLNACVMEATRLYPFFFRTERVCTKDWEEPSRGIQIKKGNVVQISIWAANRNPKYFEDPEEFKPERFLAGNKEKMHPYAFTSFGFGPRNCFGKRFAIEIMMLLAASLVRELKFIQRKDTGVKFLPAGPFFALHEPIVFDVETRN